MVFATLEYIFVSWEAMYMKGFCQVISCEETHAQGNIHVSLGLKQLAQQKEINKVT